MHAGDVIQGIYIYTLIGRYSRAYTSYIVRTPILLLPPCIFYLIRQKMHSVRCEYFISMIQASL